MTREQLDVFCAAERWARAHVPENVMRMIAQSHARTKDPPELERFAAPKLLVTVQLPTLDEILLNQKAFIIPLLSEIV